MAKQNSINFAAVNYTQFAIGLTTPGPNTLDVSGSSGIGASFAGSVTAPANGSVIQGSVGVGSTSPTTLLDVLSTSTSGTLSACVLQNFNTTAAAQKGSSFSFQTKDNGTTTRTQGALRYLTITTDALQSYASIITTNTAYTGIDISGSAGEAAVFLGNGAAVFPSGFDGVGTAYGKRGFNSGAMEIGWDATNTTGYIWSNAEFIPTAANLFIRSGRTDFYQDTETTPILSIQASVVGILTETPQNALDINGNCTVGGFATIPTVPGASGTIITQFGLGVGFTSASTPRRASLDVRGSLAVQVTVPGAYPYSATTTDYLIAVDTSSARSIVLPTAASANTGVTYVVKDATGGAAGDNITVTVNGGGNIDGAASSVINTNYGVEVYYSNGTQWFTTD